MCYNTKRMPSRLSWTREFHGEIAEPDRSASIDCLLRLLRLLLAISNCILIITWKSSSVKSLKTLMNFKLLRLGKSIHETTIFNATLVFKFPKQVQKLTIDPFQVMSWHKFFILKIWKRQCKSWWWVKYSRDEWFRVPFFL